MGRTFGLNLIFGLAATPLLLAACVLFLLLSPIYLFRWILSKLKIILRPDLYKIIPAGSAGFLIYGIEKEVRCNLHLTMKLQGKIHHEDLSAKISRVFLNSKSDGKPCFQELKMFAEYWWGFPFWTPESNLILEEHLRSEQFLAENEEDFVSKYEQNFLKIPFKYGKSPWEIVHLEGNSNSYLIFKVHHSLGDGHGLFNVIMKCMDNSVPMITPSKLNQKTSNPFRVLFNYLTFPFEVAFVAAKGIYTMTRRHPWDICIRDMCPDTRVIVKSNSIISCQKVKEGSKKHGVNFTTVLLAGITGGIRHFFDNTSQTIPDHMPLAIAIPGYAEHSGDLKNEFASIIPLLPLGEPNMSARIQKCKLVLDNSMSSKQPALHVICAHAIGSLPRCILWNYKATGQNFGFQLSNFPGPTQQIKFLGQPVVNIHHNLWCSNYIPILLSLFSYNGGIRVVVNADPNLFPSEALLQKLLDEIHTEIGLISNDCSVENNDSGATEL